MKILVSPSTIAIGTIPGDATTKALKQKCLGAFLVFTQFQYSNQTLTILRIKSKSRGICKPCLLYFPPQLVHTTVYVPLWLVYTSLLLPKGKKVRQILKYT